MSGKTKDPRRKALIKAEQKEQKKRDKKQHKKAVK